MMPGVRGCCATTMSRKGQLMLMLPVNGAFVQAPCVVKGPLILIRHGVGGSCATAMNREGAAGACDVPCQGLATCTHHDRRRLSSCS